MKRKLTHAIPALLTAVFSCFFLVSCIAAPSSSTSSSEEPEERAPQYQTQTIGIGTEEGFVDAPIDAEISLWLNTSDEQGEIPEPVPTAESWHPVVMPAEGSSVIFDPSAQTPLDLLEILAYPEGLDGTGVPVSVDVHPLCGPQAKMSCDAVARIGSNAVEIPRELVEAAIADTEYFAIGGILLPNGDSHPESFMVLLMKVDEKR